jgi:hypothetical protein
MDSKKENNVAVERNITLHVPRHQSNEALKRIVK